MADLPDPGQQRLVRRLPLALLAASLPIAVVDTHLADRDPDRLVAAIGVTLLAAAWAAFYHPFGRIRANPTVYYVVRVVLTAVLVGLNPWYGIYAWSAYTEAGVLFTGRWSYVAVAAVAPIAAASYLGGYPTSPVLVVVWLALSAGGFALVAFIATTVSRAREKEVERERTLGELTIANQRLEAALAENRGLQSQLITQAREAGMLDERARLAGEIHDTLAQAMAGIIRQVEAADRGGELTGAEHPHIDLAAELAREGLAEARRSLAALRPAQLEGSTLPDAIADVARRAALPVAVDVTGPARPLPTDQEVVLLRVMQEALANVVKHASASRVGVTLTYVDDAVILDVRDDGIGFDPDAVGVRTDGTGMGLGGMRERLARIEGSLVVESAPGDGTALVARIPA